jgi:hypothetical protein
MTEDPFVRDWFEHASKLEASDAFVDAIARRIQTRQKMMQVAFAFSALTGIGLLWASRFLLAPIAAWVTTVFGSITSVLTSPLTWILSAALSVAAWSVARCRGWDV